MLFGILEMFRNDPLLLFIITLGVACSIGGVPPILERIRRRNIENDLPAMLEALSDSLLKLSTEKIQINVIHKAVGQITESDVILASASDAIIIGFQVPNRCSTNSLFLISV